MNGGSSEEKKPEPFLADDIFAGPVLLTRLEKDQMKNQCGTVQAPKACRGRREPSSDHAPPDSDEDDSDDPASSRNREKVKMMSSPTPNANRQTDPTTARRYNPYSRGALPWMIPERPVPIPDVPTRPTAAMLALHFFPPPSVTVDNSSRYLSPLDDNSTSFFVPDASKTMSSKTRPPLPKYRNPSCLLRARQGLAAALTGSRSDPIERSKKPSRSSNNSEKWRRLLQGAEKRTTAERERRIRAEEECERLNDENEKLTLKNMKLQFQLDNAKNEARAEIAKKASNIEEKLKKLQGEFKEDQTEQ